LPSCKRRTKNSRESRERFATKSRKAEKQRQSADIDGYRDGARYIALDILFAAQTQWQRGNESIVADRFIVREALL